jgi:hypothetical protein
MIITFNALVIEPLYTRGPNPTEPVNYRYATITGSEEIVDTEIAICIVQE